MLDPLGLTHTFIGPADVMTHRFAVGHSMGDAGPEVATPWAIPRALYPAGGIVCDAGELLRYARFHLGDGT